MSIDRRTFLKTSMASGLALAAPNVVTASRSRKYRTALIGSGWWGTNIAQAALESGESKIVALCDVDDNQLKTSAAKLEKLGAGNPKKYKDYRELLAAEKPDIAIVGTPDHWHPLITIAAVKAGAHVGAGDFRGLRELEGAYEKFHRGVVFYGGDLAVPFGPCLHALPVAWLWEPG